MRRRHEQTPVRIDPFADVLVGNDVGRDVPIVIAAPGDPSFRVEASVVILADDAEFIRQVQKITVLYSLDVVTVTSPVTLIAFPLTVVQVADPACGTRADWRLFIADLRAVYRSEGEGLVPYLLYGDGSMVDAMCRRVMRWKPLTTEAYHRDSRSALLRRVEEICRIRRATRG